MAHGPRAVRLKNSPCGIRPATQAAGSRSRCSAAGNAAPDEHPNGDSRQRPDKDRMTGISRPPRSSGHLILAVQGALSDLAGIAGTRIES